MSENNWLENLKPGDKVIVSLAGIEAVEQVFTVSRVTNTQIIVGATKYRRDNGWRVGGEWCDNYIREATPERLAEIAHTRNVDALSRRLRDIRWRSLPLEALQEIVSVIDKHKKAESEADND